jgi:glyoxylase-like metal-dependent hydrolase (beta-lactamase superfamily II)
MNPISFQFTSEVPEVPFRIFRSEVLFRNILPDLFVYRGAVNSGILKWGERAILIDCDDTLTPARLAELGITAVECIYCTQHRRPNTAGIYTFLHVDDPTNQAGNEQSESAISTVRPKVFAPQDERRQFEAASAYWQDWRNRWHLYHCRPGPQAPLWDIPLSGTVGEGDYIEWGNFSIRVLDTPGMTDGAVSYVVESHADAETNKVVIFSGDVLYGPGQVWDVHSLQKNNGAWSDYHGFLGATRTLIESLAKLADTQADALIPSHRDLINDPTAAAHLTIQRLEQLYRNYAAISSLNFYFPNMFQELAADPWRMALAETADFPGFILPVAATSFAIKSESGALFLIDCGYDSVLETLNAWKEEGRFTQLEGCWVTHYHDDHVDSLHHLASMSIPIHADVSLVEIVSHQSRFFLPCISPAAAPVSHVTRDGETWQWHEFELTALHFPGQTFYHGGLLVRGRGMCVLFCGDSFAPTGLDDYTAGNRNFLGAGKGFRRCIDLVRQHRPDLILNQHQQQAFHFSNEQLDYMEKMLVEREALLAVLLPWEHPNSGTDEGWIRAYPYEIEASAGGSCTVEIRATNHTGKPVALTVEAVTPAGWKQDILTSETEPAELLPGEWIQRARLAISVPPGTDPGVYPVSFRVTWGDRYLGQVCHCLVKIW